MNYLYQKGEQNMILTKGVTLIFMVVVFIIVTVIASRFPDDRSRKKQPDKE